MKLGNSNHLPNSMLILTEIGIGFLPGIDIGIVVKSENFVGCSPKAFSLAQQNRDIFIFRLVSRFSSDVRLKGSALPC